MRIRLCLRKQGKPIYKAEHEVADAESFGKACAEAWAKLQATRFAEATSVGALFEALDEQMLDDLNGAEISLTRV